MCCLLQEVHRACYVKLSGATVCCLHSQFREALISRIEIGCQTTQTPPSLRTLDVTTLSTGLQLTLTHTHEKLHSQSCSWFPIQLKHVTVVTKLFNEHSCVNNVHKLNILVIKPSILPFPSTSFKHNKVPHGEQQHTEFIHIDWFVLEVRQALGLGTRTDLQKRTGRLSLCVA